MNPEAIDRIFSLETDRELLKRALKISFSRPPDMTLFWSGPVNLRHARKRCEQSGSGKFMTMEMLIEKQDPELFSVLDSLLAESPERVSEIWIYFSRRFAETARGSVQTSIIGSEIPIEVAQLSDDEIRSFLDSNPDTNSVSGETFFKTRVAGSIELTTIMDIPSDHPMMKYTLDFIEEEIPGHDKDIFLANFPWEPQIRNDCLDIIKEINSILGDDHIMLYKNRIRWFKAPFYDNCIIFQVDEREDPVSWRYCGVLSRKDGVIHTITNSIASIYNINSSCGLNLEDTNVSLYSLFVTCFAKGPIPAGAMLGTLPPEWKDPSKLQKSGILQMLEKNLPPTMRFKTNDFIEMVTEVIPPVILRRNLDRSWVLKGCMQMMMDEIDPGPVQTQIIVYPTGRIIVDHWKHIKAEENPNSLDEDGWIIDRNTLRSVTGVTKASLVDIAIFKDSDQVWADIQEMCQIPDWEKMRNLIETDPGRFLSPGFENLIDFIITNLSLHRDFIRTARFGGIDEAFRQVSHIEEAVDKDDLSSNLEILITELDSLANKPSSEGVIRRQVELCNQILTFISVDSNRRLWGVIHARLGDFLRAIGEIDGDINSIKRAVDACSVAALILGEDSDLFAWASNEINFGNALLRLQEEHPQLEQIHKAINHYNQALGFFTKSEWPIIYARTTSNLANALFKVRGPISDTKMIQLNPLRLLEEVFDIFNDDQYMDEYFDEALNTLGTYIFILQTGANANIDTVELHRGIDWVEEIINKIKTEQSAPMLEELVLKLKGSLLPTG